MSCYYVLIISWYNSGCKVTKFLVPTKDFGDYLLGKYRIL